MGPKVETPFEAKVIGVVGGVGPGAGLDLAAKITANTINRRDGDHLPLVMVSMPHKISDRTAFLLGQEPINPALAIFEVIETLEKAGAEIVGIPCNTAHAEPILDVVKEKMARNGVKARLVNMLDETCLRLGQVADQNVPAAVLSTLGTYRSGVYRRYMERHGLKWRDLGLEMIEKVHDVIYNQEYGIKSRLGSDFRQARLILEDVLTDLAAKGFGKVVLGCTELPLVLSESHFKDLELVDPTSLLARALIRESCPEKLKKN
ncbi:MAG: amino acid racemase [Deltaproteobacteria bacterium]|jgi:aspartate racemase|nr:amino acid racemase [Deltaproteobacteria bacterium]